MDCLVLSISCLLAQKEAYFINWTTEQADSVMNELQKSANDTLRMKMDKVPGPVYH